MLLPLLALRLSLPLELQEELELLMLRELSPTTSSAAAAATTASPLLLATLLLGLLLRSTSAAISTRGIARHTG